MGKTVIHRESYASTGAPLCARPDRDMTSETTPSMTTDGKEITCKKCLAKIAKMSLQLNDDKATDLEQVQTVSPAVPVIVPSSIAVNVLEDTILQELATKGSRFLDTLPVSGHKFVNVMSAIRRLHGLGLTCEDGYLIHLAPTAGAWHVEETPTKGVPATRKACTYRSERPAPGTILTSKSGKTCEVMADGFSFAGVVYRSISAAARAANGKPASGPKFWQIQSDST